MSALVGGRSRRSPRQDAGLDFRQTLDERLYALSDANYNVTALTDADGDVVERYAYGAATVLEPNFAADADNRSDVGNTTLYTGRSLDGESGLMYYRNRYYHTGLGGFVTRDPVGYGDGPNLYQYVQGRPTYAMDPSGQCVSNIGAAHDAYCKAAGNDETADGMARANKCFCEVTGLVQSLLGGFDGVMAAAGGFWNHACDPWLNCMGKCIFGYWSKYQGKVGGGAARNDNPKPMMVFPPVSPPHEGRTPPGIPDPISCWSGSLVMGPFKKPDGTTVGGTLPQLCADPNSRECCYALSTCEKHSLVACTYRCKPYQMVWARECMSEDSYWNDCLEAFSVLPPLSVPGIKDPINYHYDAPLSQQITESQNVCCDDPFWLK
ncbi:MAG: RHS repeat-associated core domain-containing protein [Pirellulales bacterium]|nr:RHS repeat-associated core domain-containing protein [Pirellulales bacterium]